MQGILNLDKPTAISSAQAVGRVKRLLPRGTKIGHAGTLDPFASGVLLLLIGRATKLCESMMDQPKQYEAVIKLGATTATDDPESPQVPWPNLMADTPLPDLQAINNILLRFIGQVLQTPPAFSALKVGGKRAYKLARAGAPPVMTPRRVMIYSIEMLEYNWPLLKLRVDCGRGTYIRALARDIGAALDVGGHLTELRRTRIGKFSVESAATLDRVTADSIASQLIPIAEEPRTK
jgi:tRNA pseudouridine55 synthase